MRFKGKTAVVTGGTSGIGKETAVGLVKEGAEAGALPPDVGNKGLDKAARVLLDDERHVRICGEGACAGGDGAPKVLGHGVWAQWRLALGLHGEHHRIEVALPTIWQVGQSGNIPQAGIIFDSHGSALLEVAPAPCLVQARVGVLGALRGRRTYHQHASAWMEVPLVDRVERLAKARALGIGGERLLRQAKKIHFLFFVFG